MRAETARPPRAAPVLSVLMMLLIIAHAREPWGKEARARDTTLRVVTESYAPYNHAAEDGAIIGVATAIVRATLEQAELPYRIEIMSWNRAYNMTLRRPGMLIYSIARHPEREALFQWIGPLMPNRMYLYRKAARRDVEVQSLRDAMRFRVGVHRGDSMQLLFNRAGFREFDNLVVFQTQKETSKAFFQDRIDLLPTDPFTMAYRAEMRGEPSSAYVATVLLADTANLSMAFNARTDPALVKRVREGFAAIKANGDLDRILAPYVINLPDG